MMVMMPCVSGRTLHFTYALQDMAVCYRRNSLVLTDLKTPELSDLHIGLPAMTAASTSQLPVTTAMMTPPSSQKSSCTKSISIPEEDSGFGPD